MRLSKVLAPLLSLVIVGGVFFYFLPQFTSISDVWTSIRSMTWLADDHPCPRRALEPLDLLVPDGGDHARAADTGGRRSYRVEHRSLQHAPGRGPSA